MNKTRRILYKERIFRTPLFRTPSSEHSLLHSSPLTLFSTPYPLDTCVISQPSLSSAFFSSAPTAPTHVSTLQENQLFRQELGFSRFYRHVEDSSKNLHLNILVEIDDPVNNKISVHQT